MDTIYLVLLLINIVWSAMLIPIIIYLLRTIQDHTYEVQYFQDYCRDHARTHADLTGKLK